MQFYRFPSNVERKTSWLLLTGRIGSLLGGKKSDDPTSPAYIPTLFEHVGSPAKRMSEHQLQCYERTTTCKKRLATQQAETAATTEAEEQTNNDDLPEIINPLPTTQSDPQNSSSSVMTDVTMEMIECLKRECLKRDCTMLRGENLELRKRTFCSLKTLEKFLVNT